MGFIVQKKLVKGVFVERKNRFVCIVNVDGKGLRCHLPNPGRMIELLIPNTTIMYLELTTKKTRKTDGSIVCIAHEGEIINLDSNIVSKLLPYYFEKNEVPGLRGWKIMKQEATIGKHRFDYILLDSRGVKHITEVKSTTLVRNGVACFPDAVSKRATDHLQALTEMSKSGEDTLVIFVVHRKAISFSSCADIDPQFHKAMQNAKEMGVKFLAIQASSSLVQRGKYEFLQIDLVGTIDIID